MLIRELIEELQKLDQSATVALQVYGHHYDSADNRRTHGAMEIVPSECRPDRVLISTKRW